MSSVLPAEGDLRRVIGDGAAIPDGEVDGLSHDDLLALYRNLVLLRTYDERSVIYHRQGRIGTYAIFWNHEAMQAGSVFALEDRDWIFPSYRESAIGLLRGIPASTILSWWRGHPTGWWNPEEHNVASICVPIGTHVPHAVGYAWGARLKGEDRVAIAYFGDGATSEGAVPRRRDVRGSHARSGRSSSATTTSGRSRRRSPSRRRRRRSRTRRSATGCPACGSTEAMCSPCTRRRAMQSTRARAGDGPTFIEAVSYRAAPHATADDPSIYIDPERVEEERQNECVGRFERYLRRVGVLSDEDADAVKAEALELMRAGIATAEAEPAADPALVFEHAYADPPASQAHDLAELRRLLGG